MSKTVLPSRLLRVTVGCAAEVPSRELGSQTRQSRIHTYMTLQTRKPPVVPDPHPLAKGPRAPPQAPSPDSLAPRTWSLCHRRRLTSCRSPSGRCFQAPFSDSNPDPAMAEVTV